MKNLFIFLPSIFSILMITSCSSMQKIDPKNLTNQNRLYTLHIQVTYPDEPTPPICDVFFNYDIAPTLRVPKDGWVLFKTNKKELTPSKIVCIKGMEKEKHWVSHELKIKGVSRAEESKQVTYLGHINIEWNIDKNIKVDESQFEKVKNQYKNIGEFRIQIYSNSDGVNEFLTHRIKDFQKKGFFIKETPLKSEK